MEKKKENVNNVTINVVAKPSKYAKMKASLKKNRRRVI